MTKTKKILSVVTSYRFLVVMSLISFLMIWFSKFLTYNHAFSTHRRFILVVSKSALEAIELWAVYTFIGLIVGLVSVNIYSLYLQAKTPD